MSEFVLTGSDVFGRYCRIEQFRYHSPNELFLYKVVASLRSNSWCEVPYKIASHEVVHDHMEDCVLAICCGIDETKVQRFRAADVEFLPHKTCDREALLALADKIFKDTEEDMDSRAGLVPAYISAQSLRNVAKCIREACGERAS